MNRSIKEFIKNNVLHTVFRYGQRLRFDILPRHFYSEIPDLRKLKRSNAWKRPYQPPVQGWSDDTAQLEFATEVLGTSRGSVDAIHQSACDVAGEQGFGPVEAAALRSFVATLRPPAIVQIGCGVSTALVIQAAEEAGYRPNVACVEPYPSRFLQDCDSQGKIQLRREFAENVIEDLGKEIEAMPAGSLLFIDSSHTLGPAGECTRLICELLPRLRAGSYAHFHDIMFPYDYSPHVMNQLFFWHESALLMAFLSCNDDFRIAASLSMLHHRHPEQLAKIFEGYQPMRSDEGVETAKGHFPSSCYLLRISD